MSGIVLIGGMYSMCMDEEEDYNGFFTIYTLLGFIGVVFSSLNMFASFRVKIYMNYVRLLIRCCKLLRNEYFINYIKIKFKFIILNKFIIIKFYL